MSKKLFVGGLSWGTNDDALRAAFEPFGRVLDVRVILDRETGRSRGFGFVTFDDDAEALTAMEKMDGAAVDGRNIRVNEAQERRGPGGPGGRSDTGRPAPRRGPGGAPRQPEVVRSRTGGGYRGEGGGRGDDRRPSGGGYRNGPGAGGRGPGGGGGRYDQRRGGPQRGPSMPSLPQQEEGEMGFDDRPRRDHQKSKRKKRRPHEDSQYNDGARGVGGQRRRERFDWRSAAGGSDYEEE